MVTGITSILSPLTKGAMAVWKFWKKPIGKDPSDEDVEILKCWVCYDNCANHKQNLTIDGHHFVFQKRKAFECLVTFYRKGEAYGVVLFGGSSQTPQNNAELILPKIIPDIAIDRGIGRHFTPAAVDALILAGRVTLSECLYLNSMEENISFSWQWEPDCLKSHEYRTKTVEKSEKISHEIDLAKISLKTIEYLTNVPSKGIPQSFRDRMIEGMGDGRPKKIEEILKEKRTKLEKYEEPGWFHSGA